MTVIRSGPGVAEPQGEAVGEFDAIRREAQSRRSGRAPYKYSRWARCVYCGLLRKYRVSRHGRRLRQQSCQECNRKGGLHPPTWKGWEAGELGGES
ncbi:MAG: hypothetical protein V3T07_01780 [Myxococcota bacterium]